MQPEMLLMGFKEWLTSNMYGFLIDLALSGVVLAVTYVLIKIFNRLLERMLSDDRYGGTEPDGAPEGKTVVSGSFIRSVRILLQTLLLYGGYFMAAVVILEIFDFTIIAPDDLKSLGTKALKIIIVLVGAKLAVNFGQLAVKHVFEKQEIDDGLMTTRRSQTLEGLLRSTLTYVIFFIAGLTILQIFNVNTSAILAGAGILGLAVGFGAQNLVRDIISGFFILFEDQFSVGDYVEAGGVVGTVEEIGLRTCKIRQWTGQLDVIPNGEITRVTNYNRGQMLAIVMVGIAYEEDIDRAITVLEQECVQAYRDIKAILDVPRVHGVTELADSSVNIRTVAPAQPEQYWAVERELRRRFKYALDRAGIEIPYPRRVLYQRDEENQKSPHGQAEIEEGFGEPGTG